MIMQAMTQAAAVGPAAAGDQAWRIRPIEAGDVADLKGLFLKLHLYNAALNPRFALSEDWENHLDAAMGAIIAGRRCLGLIARAAGDDQPAGFVLAAVHQDNGPWKYRDWVEVEALYVERGWRGQGLAEALLTEVYAWTASAGHDTLQLYVTASNERAIRLYEREGFRPAQFIMRRHVSDGDRPAVATIA